MWVRCLGQPWGGWTPVSLGPGSYWQLARRNLPGGRLKFGLILNNSVEDWALRYWKDWQSLPPLAEGIGTRHFQSGLFKLGKADLAYSVTLKFRASLLLNRSTASAPGLSDQKHTSLKNKYGSVTSANSGQTQGYVNLTPQLISLPSASWSVSLSQMPRRQKRPLSPWPLLFP